MKSFWNGFEKRAGMGSEVLGTIGAAPASIVGGIAGLARGAYTGDAQKDADKGFLTNFVPGVGAYRLARRYKTQKNQDKAEKK